jgi:hypothetical protein
MPVILLISKVPRGGFSSVLKGLSEGFDRPSQLVLKPIDPEALRNRVSHVLELLPGRRRQRIRVLLPELHDTPSGRIDAAKIAAYLDVPLKQLAPALRASYQAIHKTPDSPSLTTPPFEPGSTARIQLWVTERLSPYCWKKAEGMQSVRCLITLWKDTNRLRYWRSVCHREPNEVRRDGLIPEK